LRDTIKANKKWVGEAGILYLVTSWPGKPPGSQGVVRPRERGRRKKEIGIQGMKVRKLAFYYLTGKSNEMEKRLKVLRGYRHGMSEKKNRKLP